MQNTHPKPGSLRRFLICALALWVLSIQADLRAGIFNVNSTVDSVDTYPGDGIAVDDSGNITLRAAVMEANAQGGENQIILPEGTFALTLGNLTEGGQFGDLIISNNLDLSGAGSDKTFIRIIDTPAETTGNRTVRVTDQPNVSITGLTFYKTLGPTSRPLNSRPFMILRSTVGISDCIFRGIWILNDHSSLGLTNCESDGTIDTATATCADFGNAIRNIMGYVAISNCLIRRHVAPYGGAGIYNAGGTVNVSETIINDNLSGCFYLNNDAQIIQSDKAAGVLTTVHENTAGTTTLTRCTISNNKVPTPLTPLDARLGGHGVENEAGLLQIIDCTIASNVKGVINRASTFIDSSLIDSNRNIGLSNIGTIDMVNSTVSRNMGRGLAGGGGHLNFCTLTGNAGGISAAIQMGSSICADNPGGDDVTGSFISLGHNLIGDTTGGSGFAETDLLNTDPQLGVLQDNGGPTMTYALLDTSPSVDGGDPANAPQADQRSFPRPIDGDNDGVAIADIGAYEAGFTPNSQLRAYVLADNTNPEGIDLNDDGAVDIADWILAFAFGGE